MRRFFRIIYYIGGILLFVLIAIIGYTQTRSFKTYLRDIVLNESRAAINGQLQLGAFEGNLVTGLAVSGVTLSDRNGEILSAERIEIRYSLFGFLFKRLTVSDAVIVKPRINLFRSVDGSWNVASLIKTSTEDTTWVAGPQQLSSIQRAGSSPEERTYLLTR